MMSKDVDFGSFKSSLGSPGFWVFGDSEVVLLVLPAKLVKSDILHNCMKKGSKREAAK